MFNIKDLSKTCVLVLGMHRSGTSALTRLISLLGADLPATLLGGTKESLASNAKGHWESEVLVRLNDRILESAGNSWRSPELITDDWYKSSRCQDFRAEAIGSLESEFGTSRLFVFKDPRVCKLVPFWTTVLEDFGAKTVVANMVRSPAEIGKSLEARNGFDPTISELLWLRYVLEAERHSRQFPRFHVTYDDLIADCQQVLDAVVSNSEVSWPALSGARRKQILDYVSASERHHHEVRKATSAGAVAAWSEQVYAVHEKWADKGEDRRDFDLLDSIYSDLDALVQQFIGPILVAFEKTIIAHKLQKLREQQAASIEDHLQRFEMQQAAIALLMTSEGLDLESVEAHLSKPEPASKKGRTAELDPIIGKVQFLVEDIKRREIDKLAAAQASVAQSLTETAQQKARIGACQEEIKRLHEEAEKAEAINARLQLEANEAVAKLRGVRAELSEAREEALSRQNKIEAQAALHERQLKKLRAQADEAASTRRKDFAAQKIEQESRLKEVLALGKARKAEIERLRDVNAQLLAKKNDTLAALADVRDNRAMRIKAFRTEIGGFRKKLETLNGTVDALRGEIAMRDEREAKLALELAKYQSKYEDAILSKFEQGQNEPVSIFARSRALLHNPAQDREARMIDFVRESSFFDREYYLFCNPDVKKSGIDPAQHYVTFGAKEGRNPSAQFDGRKYLSRYQDVASSGMNPLVHYLTLGRRENRKVDAVSDPSARRRQKKSNGPGVKLAARSEPDDSGVIYRTPALYDADLKPQPAVEQAATAAPSPDEQVQQESSLPVPVVPIAAIDAGSRGFVALASEAEDWSGSLAIANVGAIEVGNVRIGLSDEPLTPVLAATLDLFDALRSKDAEFGRPDLLDQIVRTDLAGGTVAITNAWLSSDRELSILLGNASTESVAIRICQASAAGEPVLCFEGLVGAGASLFAHARLADRFEPVLIIVTSANGKLADASLLPFPSMVRGGLHYAELVDHLAGRGWLDGYRDYSRQILAKLLDSSRRLAISEIAVDTAAGLGSEAIFSRDLQHWLGKRFGVGIVASGGGIPDLIASPGIGRTSTIIAAQRMTGCSLTLPANAIPTLAVLVASTADLAVASAVRSVIRTDAAMRPIKSIVRPVMPGEFGHDLQTAATAAVYEGEVCDRETSLAVSVQASSHAPNDVRAVFPVSPDGAFPSDLGLKGEKTDISVIIRCNGDRDRLGSLLISLRSQTNVICDEIVLIGDVNADETTPDRIVGPRFTELTTRCLDQAIKMAGHSLIMLLEDELILHDRRTLAVLAALAGRESVASAGCQLVRGGERDAPNKDFELSFAWTPVTVRSGERFLVQPSINPFELPPVVTVAANSVRCMMIRKESWLLSVNATVDENTFLDLTIGEALRAAGFVNIATGLISVGDRQSRSRAASPVPIASPPDYAVVSLREF